MAGVGDERPVVFGEALVPFAGEERARLVRHVVRAERLGRSSFLGREQSFRMSAGVDRPYAFEMPHLSEEDDEAADALLQRLRVLYAPGRATSASYPKVSRLIREHAERRATDEARRLLDLLDNADALLERILTEKSGIAMCVQRVNPETGAVEEERAVDPREIFEDWLYGEHLHDDEDRLARIDRFRSFGFHRYTAFTTATTLTRFYLSFAEQVVQPILDTAELFEPHPDASM